MRAVVLVLVRPDFDRPRAKGDSVHIGSNLLGAFGCVQSPALNSASRDRSRQPRDGGGAYEGRRGYNAQVAVDAKNKMIVEQAVTNQVVDMGLLTQTAEPIKIEDLEACEKAGSIPHVPKPQRGSSVREGFFRKDEFRYDAGATPTSARPGSC